MADDINVLVRLLGGAKFNREAHRSAAAVSTIGAAGRKAGAGLGAVGRGARLAAVGGIAALTVEAKRSVDAFEEARKVQADTAAALKSTKGAANISEAAIGGLASTISKKAGVDDEAIQSGMNLLLTFKKVRNEAGAGNDIFSQATQTAVDMSARFGGDVRSNTLRLGKALQDPVKGIVALKRVGVDLDKDQVKQIKTLMKRNDQLGAQKIILAELASQTKGAAAAQATSLDHMGVSVGNVEEAIGAGLSPVVDEFADKITGLADRAEPQLLRLASHVQDIFGREDLTTEMKLKLTTRAARRDLAPLRREMGAIWQGVNAGEKIDQAVQRAVPLIGESLATGAPAIATSFWKAFWGASPEAKAALVGLALVKTGGLGALMRAGGNLARRGSGAGGVAGAGGVMPVYVTNWGGGVPGAGGPGGGRGGKVRQAARAVPFLGAAVLAGEGLNRAYGDRSDFDRAIAIAQRGRSAEAFGRRRGEALRGHPDGRAARTAVRPPPIKVQLPMMRFQALIPVNLDGETIAEVSAERNLTHRKRR